MASWSSLVFGRSCVSGRLGLFLSFDLPCPITMRFESISGLSTNRATVIAALTIFPNRFFLIATITMARAEWVSSHSRLPYYQCLESGAMHYIEPKSPVALLRTITSSHVARNGKALVYLSRTQLSRTLFYWAAGMDRFSTRSVIRFNDCGDGGFSTARREPLPTSTAQQSQINLPTVFIFLAGINFGAALSPGGANEY